MDVGSREMQSIEMIMAELGYTRQWMDLGVVDTDFLLRQYEEYRTAEDKNQEHYRCGAFSLFLSTKRDIRDDEIAAVFALTDARPDSCDLRVNRIIDLIVSGLLSDAQLDALSRFPEVHEAPIERRYLREGLLRKLRREGLTDGVFAAITQTQDSLTRTSGLAETRGLDQAPCRMVGHGWGQQEHPQPSWAVARKS